MISDEKMHMEEIRKEIIKTREKLGLTIDDLSKLVGMDKGNLSKYESGKLKLTYEVAQKLLSVMGCELCLSVKHPINKEIIRITLKNGQDFYDKFWKTYILGSNTLCIPVYPAKTTNLVQEVNGLSLAIDEENKKCIVTHGRTNISSEYNIEPGVPAIDKFNIVNIKM